MPVVVHTCAKTPQRTVTCYRRSHALACLCQRLVGPTFFRFALPVELQCEPHPIVPPQGMFTLFSARQVGGSARQWGESDGRVIQEGQDEVPVPRDQVPYLPYSNATTWASHESLHNPADSLTLLQMFECFATYGTGSLK